MIEVNLAKQVALVLASSKGIGFATAKKLAQAGAEVVLSSHDNTNLTKAATLLQEKMGLNRVKTWIVDLSAPSKVGQTISTLCNRLGRLDILVTNCPGPQTGRLEEFSYEQWLAAFDTILASTVEAVKAAIPFLRGSPNGSVVFLTSIACKEPIDTLLLSNSIRVGILGLMKTLVRTHSGQGIRFNAVLPAHTTTSRVEELAASLSEQLGVTVEQVYARWKSAVPLGRLAKPEEVANAVLFLVSNMASYVNGVALAVDGGLSRSLF